MTIFSLKSKACKCAQLSQHVVCQHLLAQYVGIQLLWIACVWAAFAKAARRSTALRAPTFRSRKYLHCPLSTVYFLSGTLASYRSPSLSPFLCISVFLKAGTPAGSPRNRVYPLVALAMGADLRRDTHSQQRQSAHPQPEPERRPEPLRFPACLSSCVHATLVSPRFIFASSCLGGLFPTCCTLPRGQQ